MQSRQTQPPQNNRRQKIKLNLPPEERSFAISMIVTFALAMLSVAEYVLWGFSQVIETIGIHLPTEPGARFRMVLPAMLCQFIIVHLIGCRWLNLSWAQWYQPSWKEPSFYLEGLFLLFSWHVWLKYGFGVLNAAPRSIVDLIFIAIFLVPIFEAWTFGLLDALLSSIMKNNFVKPLY